MRFSSGTIAAILSSCTSTVSSVAMRWLLTSSSSLIATVAQAANLLDGDDDEGHNDMWSAATATADDVMASRVPHLLATSIKYYDKNKLDKNNVNVDTGILSSSSSSDRGYGDIVPLVESKTPDGMNVSTGATSKTTAVRQKRAVTTAKTITETLRLTPVKECVRHGHDYVDCDNGFVRGMSNTVTCASECGGKCCTGKKACDEFTGKVCKDGSCDGNNACTKAIIPWVVNSCKDGDIPCFKAGMENGTIINVVNSCHGYSACCSLSRTGATVGEVQNSCNGEEACYYLSYGSGLVVGNVIDSCNGKSACHNVANGYFQLPSQGDLINTCNGVECCYNADTSPPLINCIADGNLAVIEANADRDVFASS